MGIANGMGRADGMNGAGDSTRVSHQGEGEGQTQKVKGEKRTACIVVLARKALQEREASRMRASSVMRRKGADSSIMHRCMQQDPWG